MSNEPFELKTCPCCGSTFVPKTKTRKYCYACDVSSREKTFRDSKERTLNCKHCGKPFTTTRSVKVFCSDKCNSAHRTNLNKSDKPEQMACVCCGKMFSPISVVNKTCSTQCSRRQTYLKSKERPETVTKTCVICGNEFIAKRVLDVCCSKECQSKHARKRQVRTLTCIDCGIAFEHSNIGTPKRCHACRTKPKVKAKQPCACCGKEFTQQTGEDNKYCSRTCSALRDNTKGLYTREAIGAAIVTFIRNSRHTPTLPEIADAGGISMGGLSKMGESVFSLFEKAGRKNRSLFPSKFEEMVYYVMLDCGISNDDIQRQKTFPNLHGPSRRWPLRFDFYIESLNLLVEADGPQHEDGFKASDYFPVTPHETDKIKDLYVQANNLRLIRIKYSPYFNTVSHYVTEKLRPFMQQCMSNKFLNSVDIS